MKPIFLYFGFSCRKLMAWNLNLTLSLNCCMIWGKSPKLRLPFFNSKMGIIVLVISERCDEYQMKMLLMYSAHFLVHSECSVKISCICQFQFWIPIASLFIAWCSSLRRHSMNTDGSLLLHCHNIQLNYIPWCQWDANITEEIPWVYN